MFSDFLAIIFACILFLTVFLNFLSLPGNWVMAVLVLISAAVVPDATYGTLYWILFFSLLILGEIAEFYLQIHQGKKVNASSSSNILGIVGAIAGGILLMPLFFGFGAVIGTLAGAFAGAYAGEKFLAGNSAEKSLQVAKASLMGKFLGILIKFGIGIYLVFYTAKTIFAVI